VICAVVFDLDGTLIDSTEAIVRSFTHAFEVIGRPFPGAQAIIDTIGYPLREQFPLLTDAPLEDCIRHYRAHHDVTSCANTTLLPGAGALLQALQDAGVAMGFASSKSCAAACRLLDHLGVLSCFEARIGPEQVTRTKPDPEPVLKAMEVLGASREEAVFVGDMHFDLLAGAAAGVRTLAVTTGYATREALEQLQPTAIFDSLAEVQDYLLPRCRGMAGNAPRALSAG
jgi:HAD superfamily hydrolase (TIGR01509 family)